MYGSDSIAFNTYCCFKRLFSQRLDSMYERQDWFVHIALSQLYLNPNSFLFFRTQPSLVLFTPKTLCVFQLIFKPMKC